MCMIQYYQIVSFIDQKKSTERLKFFEKQSISLYFDIDMMTTVTCCLAVMNSGAEHGQTVTVYRVIFTSHLIFSLLILKMVSPRLEFAKTGLCLKREI